MSITFLLNIFLLAFPPVIFWGYFYYVRDRKEPEPLRLIVRSFIIGIAVALPVKHICYVFDLFPQLNIFAGISTFIVFIILGYIEEFVKLLTLMVLTKKKAIDVDQIIDGVIYGVMIALGFSFMENIFYFAQYLKFAEKGIELYGTYFVRGFGTMFAHTVFTGIAGYLYVLGKVEKKHLWIKGIFLAGTLHALFNLFMVTSIAGYKLAYLNVPLLAFSLWVLINLMNTKKSEKMRWFLK